MLDATVLADLQGDIGISDDESVFSDDEIERLYTRSDSNADLAVYFAFRQLLANANKFYDYSAGMTSEKRSQIRTNLKDSVNMWEKESGGTNAANQVGSVGVASIPYYKKDKPWRTGRVNRLTREDYSIE